MTMSTRPHSLTLSRRSILQGAAAASGSLLLSGLQPARAATPARGGQALIAFQSAGPADTLDPVRQTSDIDVNRATQIYDTLTRLDPARRPQPLLAEAFEPGKPDATEWIFRLRKGATFHNGKTVDADDVAYSLKRHVGPDSPSAIKSAMAQIAEIRPEGESGVRIILSAPNAEFPALLCDPRAAIVPAGQVDFLKPIGSGPFKVEEFRPGERARFVRFADYWAADHIHLDAIETFSIPDPLSRLNALLAGEIHFAVGIDIKSLALLEKSPVAKPVLARSGQVVDIAMMIDHAPFDNVDFRTALKLLQDRQKVVDTVYKGYAQIGNDHEVAPNDPVYCADIPVRAYDPDKARFHLQKAGLTNVELDLYTSTGSGPGAVEQALLLQQTARPAGVKLNIKQVPADGYWKSTWMKHPLFSSQWNVRPNSDTLWSTLHHSGSSSNETQFKSERLDNLLATARAELDETKRRGHWCDLQRLVHEEGGNLVSAFPDYLHARATALIGEILSHPMGNRGGFLSGFDLWLGKA
ncbi:peptide/nickel transport system substrate-binding protein [Angulomicrobium tetraedrale]|uniref:Peptide/nickel transport system substrate-binding protein n=1 Tax=Ancylobacter tetraedralis TaxID=217068 RepID=A0A839ZGT8_9HYPH|nr:ABC transporter substrate-binding protein [Ancylobacter tetraedralis]MBB3773765.1 peptide/nickel transport system substrate-binding protein [Ancylobacter tetraedralis]